MAKERAKAREASENEESQAVVDALPCTNGEVWKVLLRLARNPSFLINDSCNTYHGVAFACLTRFRMSFLAVLALLSLTLFRVNLVHEHGGQCMWISHIVQVLWFYSLPDNRSHGNIVVCLNSFLIIFRNK